MYVNIGDAAYIYVPPRNRNFIIIAACIWREYDLENVGESMALAPEKQVAPHRIWGVPRLALATH
jgi:hypothetical protein